VTQATLKVVGAFHGLSRARSDARRYPAIDPLESWSKYKSVIENERVERLRNILRAGNDVGQMMKVVGEEGTSPADFVTYLKGEFLDAVYLQQNAFSDIDAATSEDRQKVMFDLVEKAMLADYPFTDKTAARKFFQGITQAYIDWNQTAQDAPDYETRRNDIAKKIEEASQNV
ncbi:MAG: V-type ATP synthase subunit A, partial [Kiritimatiellae bacterium]|nr:V-type ATP synthase subunit A [Kiritimatiellia bacterium]